MARSVESELASHASNPSDPQASIMPPNGESYGTITLISLPGVALSASTRKKGVTAATSLITFT